jgi:putative ABC transport system permease protein
MSAGQPGPESADSGLRVWRLLLRLLPARFRRRYGDAMEDTFRMARADARAIGRLTVLRLYANEAVTFVRSAVVLRLPARDAPPTVAGRPSRRLPGADVLDDVVFAARSLCRNLAFFGFAALTLGLGIGATTAIYSALRSVVLEAPRYPGGERAVTIWRALSGGMRLSLSPEQVDVVLGESGVFDAVARHTRGTVTVTGLGGPVRLEVVRASAELAELMSVRPLLGRLFAEDELAGTGERVLLLSHALWRSQHGGRADVVGETLTVNGEPWTIIGVLPPTVVRADGMPDPIDLWLPLGRGQPSPVVARLRADVTIEEATARLQAVLNAGDDFDILITPATALRAGMLREPLRILMVAVALLLLIACVNVSNLLLHRGVARTRDTAVRAALGASRGRLLRYFLVESLLLALAGAVIGAAVAWAGTTAAASLRPAELASLQGVRIDGTVLAFSLALSLGAWLLFSLPPAVRGTRADAVSAVSRSLRWRGAGSARLRWTLIGLEVALSFALLVGAASLIGSVRASAARDSGYQPDSFVALDVRLPAWRYRTEADRRAAFDELLERVRRVPGVDMAALGGGAPPRWGIMFGRIHADGRAGEMETSVFHGGPIDVGYLRAIGQPLVAGREFLPHEVRDGAAVVVLGEAAARRIFAGEDAVGRRFRLDDDEYTVVGIARDIAIVGLSEPEHRPIAYFPASSPGSQMMVIVRTARRDPALTAMLTALVRQHEPDAVVTVERGSALLGATLARERFTAALLSTFAALALLLSAVGLYGVLSQIVTGRTHEIGLRVALGADAAGIRTLVLGSGVRVVAGGLLAGALVVNVGLKLLGSRVFGVQQHGAAYVAAAVLLGATSLFAMWRPAARATRIDPMRAMSDD